MKCLYKLKVGIMGLSIIIFFKTFFQMHCPMDIFTVLSTNITTMHSFTILRVQQVNKQQQHGQMALNASFVFPKK